MKRIISILLLIRSIPAILVYHSLSVDTQHLISYDYDRCTEKITGFQLHERLLHDLAFRRLFFVRILKESYLKYLLVRWTYKPLESLEISTTTGNIGAGLQIFHGYSTIIFCHSIGNNLTVYQNVTLGRGKSRNGNDVPIIGNNVTIYTGAIVIGGITIGDNAVIGAGAVVVKDVPANVTVVGNGVRYLDNK